MSKILCQFLLKDTPGVSVPSLGHTPMSFSANNCKDFEEKVQKKDENDIFYNFHHAHRVSEGFLRHICQDKSSCDSPFKSDYDSTKAKLAHSII